MCYTRDFNKASYSISPNEKIYIPDKGASINCQKGKSTLLCKQEINHKNPRVAFIEHFVCSRVAKSSKREKRLSLSHNGIRESTRDTAAAVGHLPTSTNIYLVYLWKTDLKFGRCFASKDKEDVSGNLYCHSFPDGPSPLLPPTPTLRD